MKKITFILTLLFSSLIANALTVDQLIKYYRNMPDIQCEVIKGKELQALLDSASTNIGNKTHRTAKKLIFLGFLNDEEQRSELSSKLETLDDYSIAFSYTKDTPGTINPLLSTITGLETSVAVEIYSKNSSSNDYLSKPLFVIYIWGMVGLAYLDGNINQDIAKDFVEVTFNTSYSISPSPARKSEKQSTLKRLNHQLSIYPQEKLHVVTDRDLYCGGDTIWLRAFVVDADTHTQTAISKYVYVELLTPFGFADKRVKLMERDGIYAGYIPIDEEIYEGDYTLSAYTAYSENQGKDFFFRKPLRIMAPQSSKYTIESKFLPAKDGEVTGNFKIMAIEGNPINYKVMSWTMPDGNTLEMPHADNGLSRNFNRSKDEKIVLVKFGDYGKYFTIEYPVESTDISFYPEGGWLIANQPCTVAFKATDENGKGINASGVIKNNRGDEIVKFSTVHNGMGSFTFIPESGDTYAAYFSGPDGASQSVEIGSPKDGAAALRYRAIGSKGTFSVAGRDGEELELVVALRGAGIISAPISATTPLSFDKDEMPEGLYQAFLVSKSDNAVLSERLFFLGADRKATEVSELSADSTTISLRMPKGNSADCTVRITNGNITGATTDNDIRTQLMLQSELRGRIENPSYYFTNNTTEAERNLDLLMMVNGWSRYNLPDAIQGKYEEPKIPLEIGQEISGQVRSRWKNSPMEGVYISAIAPKMNFGTFAETDKNGMFHINGFDFPEGTSYIFKAMNETGALEANYEIYPDEFPEIDVLHNSTSVVSDDQIADFFKGSRWTLLDEVNVQAFKESNDNIYANFVSYSRSADDMKMRGISSVWQALNGLGGISDHMGHLKWRNSEINYYIDGKLFDPRGNATMVYDVAGQPSSWRSQALPENIGGSSFYGPTLSEIEAAVPFQTIERIDFIRPEHSIVLGPSYGGAAVVITTKKGDKVNWERQFELKDYLPLGYQHYKEYASPLLSIDTDEYELQSHPTLLWIPSAKFDENGKSINLKFPIKSNYKVIIEGISDNGDIISETSLLTRH
ncbi:MAG: hypothetical protein K2G85_04055 [Muribaculaceae bacterium]|nr:hypothetical protein [Muribaculaceae bacterium]